MVKTKTTPHGGKSHRPTGMATTTFTGTSRGKTDPEEQFRDTPGEDTEDSIDLPRVLEDAELPKEGESGTSKSKGNTGKPPAQATEGAEAPPEETSPDPNPTDPKPNPNPTNPQPNPNPIDPQPGTSKDPTKVPTEVPTKNPTQNPNKEAPPVLTEYVKAYKAAGKAWLDTVVEKKEQAYITLYDTLQQLGDPHIDNLGQADRKQVFKCIRDRSGRFLSEDQFTVYVEREEEKEKPKYRLTGDAKEALKDYFDAVHTLCEA